MAGRDLEPAQGWRTLPAQENISVVKDSSGQVAHYVSLLSDISTIKGTKERLKFLAHHDALTGLPNRLLFLANLENTLVRARRHKQKFAVLFLDLDRFKLINYTMGHAAGDQLLQEVGSRLKQSVPGQDIVTRIGGDEFSVVIEEIAQTEDAAHLAENVINAITACLYRWQGRSDLYKHWKCNISGGRRYRGKPDQGRRRSNVSRQGSRPA